MVNIQRIFGIVLSSSSICTKKRPRRSMKRDTLANKGPAIAWAICRERPVHAACLIDTHRLSYCRGPDGGSANIASGLDYAKFLLICLVA